MNNIRESSQQDRRVYVGNLSYDVKWHHLKDFMRQGGFTERRLAGTRLGR
jgi:RNA recognition motif-containing protein